MPLIPITYYKCPLCERIYAEDLGKCVCERTIFIKGEKFGSFIIVEQSEKDQYVIVRCILCSSDVELHYTNIKRQKSCGCKPKWIELLEVTETKVVYKCGKCQKEHMCVPPIMTYCCE